MIAANSRAIVGANPRASIDEADAALANNGFAPLARFEKDPMLESPDAHAMLSAIRATFIAKHGFKSMKQARRRLHCTEAEVVAQAMAEFSSPIGGAD